MMLTVYTLSLIHIQMCIRDRLYNKQNEQHIKNNNNNKKWATFTYINNKMTKLTKLFKNTDIKIAYKTNKNKLQILNSSHNKDNTRCV